MIYTNIKQLEDSNRVYNLILSDPPWQQARGGLKKKSRPKSSGRQFDYPTLSLEDIKEHLRIATEHTTPNAILFLWTIDKYLFEAQQLAEELGWKLHARMIWDKKSGPPASFDIRFAHEYLLYMYKGKFISADKQAAGKFSSVFRDESATKRRHSQKPEQAFKIIEALYPQLGGAYLEMYARIIRPNWDQFGNELNIESKGGVADEFNKDKSTTS